MDPSSSTGLSLLRMQSGFSMTASSISSPVDLPLTVCVAGSTRSPSAFMTAETPPASPSSVTPHGPDGASLTRVGVSRLSRSQVSKLTSTPASFAIAIMWSTMLVEPPTAIPTRMALSNASRVRICDGRRSSFTSSMIRMPVYFAARIW